MPTICNHAHLAIQVISEAKAFKRACLLKDTDGYRSAGYNSKVSSYV